MYRAWPFEAPGWPPLAVGFSCLCLILLLFHWRQYAKLGHALFFAIALMHSWSRQLDLTYISQELQAKVQLAAMRELLSDVPDRAFSQVLIAVMVPITVTMLLSHYCGKRPSSDLATYYVPPISLAEYQCQGNEYTRRLVQELMDSTEYQGFTSNASQMLPADPEWWQRLDH